MKTLEYLSPTSIEKYLESREGFYLKYLSDNRPPGGPQTRPMSVGSAFDSYVKSHLRYLLNGENESELFEQYFESSVEPINRNWAREPGKIVFDNYKHSGALQDLVVEMSKASEGPKFEFFIKSEGKDQKLIREYAGGVKFLGKPDAWYVTEKGNHIILDWKVNGYCSKNGASPKKGYVMIRDGIVPKPTRGANSPHKDAILMADNGTLIDTYCPMEIKDASWARQLAIYSWLCGEYVGAKIIGAIDQIVCFGDGRIRVAEHRCYIGQQFQLGLFNLAKEIWTNCTDGHYFKDLTLEQSQQRCYQLDQIKDVMLDPRVAAMYGR